MSEQRIERRTYSATILFLSMFLPLMYMFWFMKPIEAWYINLLVNSPISFFISFYFTRLILTKNSREELRVSLFNRT